MAKRMSTSSGQVQEAYNKEHGITPKTIEKSVRDLISISKKVAKEEIEFKKDPESMSREELEQSGYSPCKNCNP